MTTVHYFFFKIGILFLLFGATRLTAAALDRFPVDPLILLGRTSLFGYCAHLIAIYYVFGPFWLGKLEPGEQIGGTVALAAVMLPACWLWQRRSYLKHLILLAPLAVVGSIGCDTPPESVDHAVVITEDIPFEKDADPPVCQDAELTSVVDVHEHTVGPEGVEALTAAMPLAGVDRSVAFPMFEDYYQDSVGILQAAKESGGALIPFVAIDVRDPQALAFLKVSIGAGAEGLKLFSGHSEIHDDTPLDSQLAEPIYEYLEQTGTPLLMHVNGRNYLHELERVLDAHPDLVMVCPHFCLFAGMPGQLARLLDKYPNLSIDISFGNTSATLTGFGGVSKNIDVWRRFVRVYVDRITFGTDRVFMLNSTQDHDFMNYRAYLGLVQDSTFEYMGVEYQGLAGDACTQKHILQHNAER
ncbi:MAG: amidohydrolase family protein, partial [Deltaproteobacteria bacterium]|nr:amidohydrolase family protein [Deltaproteobacteria bacterium]